MQQSGGYFVSSEDDHGSLLASFSLPLSIEDDATAHHVVPFSSGHEVKYFSSSLNGHSNYYDPLQSSQLSGAQLHDLDKQEQGKSDHMKLTFIMDTAADSSNRTSTSTLSSSPGLLSSAATPASVQDVDGGLPSPSTAPARRASALPVPAILVPGHSNKRMQACSACGLVFAMKSKALFHLYTQHPESAPAKVYPCTSCDNAFLRKSDMVRRDLRLHLSALAGRKRRPPARPPSNSTVVRDFPTEQTKHFDCVHLRLRPSKCTECTSAFFFRKDLAKHVRTVHEKRRDHACVSSGDRLILRAASRATALVF
jgi:hypothetical protein